MKNIQPAFDAAGYEGPTATVHVTPAPAPHQQQQQQQGPQDCPIKRLQQMQQPQL